MTKAKFFLVLTTCFALTACAGQPLIEPGSRGFFWGLIDGALAPISFVISLFNNGIPPL